MIMEDSARERLTGVFAGRRVLLAEDSYLVADELEHMLEGLGCSVVGPFPTVAAAGEAARSAAVDLALLDVNLNGDRVYPVAAELMSRRVPLIFLTGYGAESIDPEFRPFPRLTKPFSRADLQRAMEPLLSGLQ